MCLQGEEDAALLLEAGGSPGQKGESRSRRRTWFWASRVTMKQDGLPLRNPWTGTISRGRPAAALDDPGPDQKRDAPLIITDGIEVKERLRSEILNRRSVDIFGVAPPVLCAVIREEAPRLHDHVLRYFTLRNRPSLDSGAALGPLTQSWSQALKTITAYAGHHRHLEVLGYEDNYTECLTSDSTRRMAVLVIMFL